MKKLILLVIVYLLIGCSKAQEEKGLIVIRASKCLSCPNKEKSKVYALRGNKRHGAHLVIRIHSAKRFSPGDTLWLTTERPIQ